MNEHLTALNGTNESPQFAYARNSSTTIALIRVTDSWKLAIDQKKYTVTVFLDLRKAFDIINHDILLNKVKDLGFGIRATRWFKSYLTDIQQYVYCNRVESETRKITCGVPQGSVLGPSLFNVYYNSIADCFVHSETTLYADDSEAHCSHFSVHGAETAMNNDLQNVEQWLKANRTIANIKKTKSMLIGSRPALRKAEAENIQIHLFNNKIEEVTTFDYLGVRMTNTLSWKPHVDRLCQRSYPKMKLLHRVSSFLPTAVLLRIYKQTILPIIDYGSIIWQHCGSVLSNRVEKIQNKAMRTILCANRATCTQEKRNRL